MVEFDRDSQCRPRARHLVLAALGLAVAGFGGAACVTNPYYMPPADDTESRTDPSGDASTSADPTDTTDGTTGDPGTATDATSTTSLSTTEPLTSGSSLTTDPDESESESEGDCPAIQTIELEIDEDAFFIDSLESPCGSHPWSTSEKPCGALNFGATLKAPLIESPTLKSSLGLRPPLDALQEHLKDGELKKAWFEVTFTGTLAQATMFTVGVIHPLETWSPGDQFGEPPGDDGSTYHNRMDGVPWTGKNGPVGVSQTLFCGANLMAGDYTNKTLKLCEFGPGLTGYIQELAQINPDFFQGLVVYPTVGGGGPQLFVYASGSASPAKIVLEICTN